MSSSGLRLGLMAPVGTPPEVITRVHADFTGVLQKSEVRDRISGMGADVVGNSQEQFAAFMRGESAKWARVIKKASVKAE